MSSSKTAVTPVHVQIWLSFNERAPLDKIEKKEEELKTNTTAAYEYQLD